MRKRVIPAVFAVALAFSGHEALCGGTAEIRVTGVVGNNDGLPEIPIGSSCELTIVVDLDASCSSGLGSLSCSQSNTFRLRAGNQTLIDASFYSILATNEAGVSGDSFNFSAFIPPAGRSEGRVFVFSSQLPGGNAFDESDLESVEALIDSNGFTSFPTPFVFSGEGLTLSTVDFICSELTIEIEKDDEPEPEPNDTTGDILALIRDWKIGLGVARLELNPGSNPTAPVEKAIAKVEKRFETIQKKAIDERILKAFIGFSTVSKTLNAFSSDLLRRFLNDFRALGDTVERDAESRLAQIERSRAIINQNGASVSRRLESKLVLAEDGLRSLQRTSPTTPGYYKTLKRLGLEKLEKKFARAAAKAVKKAGGR